MIQYFNRPSGTIGLRAPSPAMNRWATLTKSLRDERPVLGVFQQPSRGRGLALDTRTSASKGSAPRRHAFIGRPASKGSARQRVAMFDSVRVFLRTASSLQWSAVAPRWGARERGSIRQTSHPPGCSPCAGRPASPRRRRMRHDTRISIAEASAPGSRQIV